jgi:uncharacterized membrane protein
VPITAPPIVPAPAPRAGRHLRRSARRMAAVAAVAAIVIGAVVAFAGPVPVAIALMLGAQVLFVAICRLLAASMHDAAEERWLRHALHGLEPAIEDDDEEPGLYVS